MINWDSSSKAWAIFFISIVTIMVLMGIFTIYRFQHPNKTECEIYKDVFNGQFFKWMKRDD